MHGEIREWAQNLPTAKLFDLDDIQRAFPDKSRNAIKMGISRICVGDNPVVTRLTRGIYCRRRDGSRVAIPYQARPALAMRVAGAGAGFTGPYVINELGWSTQVPPCPWIAVLGRPPRCPEAGVVFQGRANKKRATLSVQEVTLLEAVRCFDDWAEMSWINALVELEDTANNGYYTRTANRVRLIDAASNERGLGPSFFTRCEEIAEVACVR